jgi:hypothetical protein
VQDMDDPEQMMKNCVLNVCQPGALLTSPSLPPSCWARTMLLQQWMGILHMQHQRGLAKPNSTSLPGSAPTLDYGGQRLMQTASISPYHT